MSQHGKATVWDRIRRRPVIGAIFFAAAFLGAVTILVRAGFDSWAWIYERTHWREIEYERLATLKAGFAFEKIRDVLGSPTFQRKSQDGKLVESSFRGREYWVQTVHNPEGTVVLYAVTSCDSRFTPSFQLPDPPARITLRQSRLASVRGKQVRYAEARYFLSSATANSSFFDEYSGGNPGNYKTYAWGLNDACPDWFDEQDKYDEVLPFSDHPIEGFAYEGGIRKAPAGVIAFRKVAVVNTYAETAPFFEMSRVREAFQLGVDRILIRTAY